MCIRDRNGPVASISVGLIDGEIVLNPNVEQRAKTDLNLTVAGSKEKIVMIEAGANEIDEKTMLNAICTGHEDVYKRQVLGRNGDFEAGRN